MGRSYPRTHDLGVLLELLEKSSEAVPLDAWDLVELTDFAVQLRYDSYEYDDEPLDRPTIVRQVAILVEHVGKRVALMDG